MIELKFILSDSRKDYLKTIGISQKQTELTIQLEKINISHNIIRDETGDIIALFDDDIGCWCRSSVNEISWWEDIDVYYLADLDEHL